MESIKSYMDWAMDDIVFENRNKAYGSYQNKKAISRNVMIGLAASLLGFVMLVLVQGIDWSSLGKTPQEKENITSVKLCSPPTVKLPPPPLLVPVLPPPPVRPSVRFTQMVVKKEDTKIEEDKDQPPVEEIKQQDNSTVTNVGDTTVTLVIRDTLPPVKQLPVVDTTVYDFVDQRPEFPGGDEALDAFIQYHIIHPEGERINGVEEKVLVVLVVKEDGSITDPRVPIGVSPVLAKEALRVVKMLPKFKPGRLQGRAVRVYFHIPISFDLKTM